MRTTGSYPTFKYKSLKTLGATAVAADRQSGKFSNRKRGMAGRFSMAPVPFPFPGQQSCYIVFDNSHLAEVAGEVLVNRRLEALKVEIAGRWDRKGGDHSLTLETGIFWRRGAPIAGR